MDNERQATIRKLVADEHVKHIQLWFTDILGNLKMVEVPDRQLDSVIESARRLRRLVHHRLRRDRGVRHRRDARLGHLQGPALVAEPRKTGFVFCDVLGRDYKPFEGDPRWVLRRQLERARALGLEFYVGPELEYFYFKGDRPSPS
jgi:glutamine synthetase